MIISVLVVEGALMNCCRVCVGLYVQVGTRWADTIGLIGERWFDKEIYIVLHLHLSLLSLAPARSKDPPQASNQKEASTPCIHHR